MPQHPPPSYSVRLATENHRGAGDVATREQPRDAALARQHRRSAQQHHAHAPLPGALGLLFPRVAQLAAKVSRAAGAGLVQQLLADAAIRSADTLMLTIPSQLGVEFNLRVVESFAKYVAPALGWKPSV